MAAPTYFCLIDLSVLVGGNHARHGQQMGHQTQCWNAAIWCRWNWRTSTPRSDGSQQHGDCSGDLESTRKWMPTRYGLFGCDKRQFLLYGGILRMYTVFCPIQRDRLSAMWVPTSYSQPKHRSCCLLLRKDKHNEAVDCIWAGDTVDICDCIVGMQTSVEGVPPLVAQPRHEFLVMHPKKWRLFN